MLAIRLIVLVWILDFVKVVLVELAHERSEI